MIKDLTINQTEKKGGRKPITPIIAVTIIVLTLTIGGYTIYGNRNSYLNCVGIWKNNRKVFYRQSVDDAKRFGNIACRERGQVSLMNLKQFWLDPRYPESLNIAMNHNLKHQLPGFNISVYPEGKEYEPPAFLESTRIEYKQLVPDMNNNSNPQSNTNNNSNIAKALDRDPYEEVFDGATVYKICETGSYFNSMINRDNGGRGFGAVLDGRSMMYPDKLPYRELQRLKNLMRKYCPEALYIER